MPPNGCTAGSELRRGRGIAHDSSRSHFLTFEGREEERLPQPRPRSQVPYFSTQYRMKGMSESRFYDSSTYQRAHIDHGRGINPPLFERSMCGGANANGAIFHKSLRENTGEMPKGLRSQEPMTKETMGALWRFGELRRARTNEPGHWYRTAQHSLFTRYSDVNRERPRLEDFRQVCGNQVTYNPLSKR